MAIFSSLLPPLLINDRLLCDVPERIGVRVSEIKAHPFFKGADWDHIRYGMEPGHVYCSVVPFPFHRDRPAAIPVQVKHMADTSNFDDFEELSDQKKSLFFIFSLPLSVC